MADLNAFKTELTAVVNDLAKTVMAEILQEVNKMSARKLQAEGKLNSLVDRLCVSAVHQILSMAQLTALKQGQTPGHLEDPSGDLEDSPGDLEDPLGDLEDPPQRGQKPRQKDPAAADLKSPPESEQSSRSLTAAGVSGVRPPPAQTYLLVYQSASKFVLLPLQGHANANAKANGGNQTCGSAPHLQPDVLDHEYARPAAQGGKTRRRRRIRRRRERSNANAKAKANIKAKGEPGAPCRCAQCGKLLPNPQLLSEHQRRLHPQLHPTSTSAAGVRQAGVPQAGVPQAGAPQAAVPQAGVPHNESACPSTAASAEGGASNKKEEQAKANANANAEGGNEAVSEVKATESPSWCSQCGKLYANAERLSDHKRKVHRVCSVCGITLTAIDLRKHMMNQHGLLPYGCSICPKRFNHLTHRNLHVKSVHTGEKNFKCDLCGKAYSCPSMVKTHRTTHFDKKFTCDICGRSFFHAAHLKRHKLTHQEVRPYQCSTCGKGFNQAPNLRRHQAHHTGDRPLCSICGRSYYNLKSHLISQHPYELPADDPLKARDSIITCEVCGRSFSTPSQFKIHQRSHTGEKPFSCDVCGKSYRMKQQLRDHRYSHTGEKPYSCPLCPKTFYLATSFMRHRSIHTGETPYSCLDCGKHFRLLTFLKAHQQTKAHLRKTQKKRGAGADLRGEQEEDEDVRKRRRRWSRRSDAPAATD